MQSAPSATGTPYVNHNPAKLSQRDEMYPSASPYPYIERKYEHVGISRGGRNQFKLRSFHFQLLKSSDATGFATNCPPKPSHASHSPMASHSSVAESQKGSIIHRIWLSGYISGSLSRGSSISWHQTAVAFNNRFASSLSLDEILSLLDPANSNDTLDHIRSPSRCENSTRMILAPSPDINEQIGSDAALNQSQYTSPDFLTAGKSVKTDSPPRTKVIPSAIGGENGALTGESVTENRTPEHLYTTAQSNWLIAHSPSGPLWKPGSPWSDITSAFNQQFNSNRTLAGLKSKWHTLTKFPKSQNSPPGTPLRS